MIVVGRIASGVGGSSSPISSRPCLSRTASPIPAASPTDGAQEPDHQGLDDHGSEHLPAAGPQRSQEPQLAGPLRHHDVERVEDHEGPDEQRDEREHEQRRAEETQALANLLGLLGGGVGRRDRLEAGREHLLDLRGDRRRRRPLFRHDVDLIEAAFAVEEALRGLELERRDRGAPDRRWRTAAR